MIKISRIIENADFRTVDIHLETKSYSIKISEKEIDDELINRGENPVQQRLYATSTANSRNMIAADVAHNKLLEILEDEILEINGKHEYLVKQASDWDSVQSHHKKLNKDNNNIKEFWNDFDRKRMMIDGKYVYRD